MALTGRFVALAALGLLLVLLPPVALVMWAAVLVGAGLVDVALAGRIRDLDITRDGSTSVRLYETGHTALRLVNTGRRALHARIRDAWAPSAGLRPRETVLRVRAGERGVVAGTLTPTRRGERSAGQVTIRSIGPLGLAARQRRVSVPGSVLVLPAFTSRRLLPEKLARLRQIEGGVVVQRRGQGSEFDSLREYVPGDDVRSIDWRATARSGTVAVRTWRPERDRLIVLVLDTGRTTAVRLGDGTRLDAAMDAALLLGAIAAGAGDRVAVLAADVAVRARMAPQTGPAILAGLVSTLTPLQPALTETDPQLLVTEVTRRTSRRALIVLFSALDSTDSPVAEAARLLSVRHQVIVASVADPRVAELAGTRADALAVYTAAAAERTLTDRSVAADVLSRGGVRVIDGSATDFAGQVVDAYLDLKAAGRL